ncbi:acyl carrier protein [Gelatiniphilus marinus]|uniref:Acyl carrier protein n=1 Tax=Gelatiniphilus marinus TaxID=1759464 RepID=A0ABW5JPL6_9FLAO
MEINKILSTYITNEFVQDQPEKIAFNDDILSSGIVDSIGMIRLVNFIEKEFGIEVLSEEMTFDNFKSIETITDYIQQKITQLI